MNNNHNAILVYELNGSVRHRFCPEAEARAELEQIALAGGGGSMFATDSLNAEFTYNAAAELRERVDAAKEKLRRDLRIKHALDAANVPADRDLRLKIYAAFLTLM